MAKANQISENPGAVNGTPRGWTTLVIPRGNSKFKSTFESKNSKTSAQKPEEAFIAAMLEEPSENEQHRSPLEWLASVAFHFAVIAALIIVPLYFTQTLNVKAFQNTWLVAPPPAAPAPPPPPAAAVVRSVKSAPHFIETGKLTAPTVVPKHAAIIKEAPPRLDSGAEGLTGGVPGGVAGGQPGGVLGGIIGGTGHAAVAIAAPPPPPAPVKHILRVGGNLKPPKQTYYEAPVYPIIAKDAHIEGTVGIDAVIDEHGNVVQARAVSGPPLLIAAALQTVLKWKYEPSYLNGEPVSVEMHVDVHFVMQ
jgi:periplasmic protein TonB